MIKKKSKRTLNNKFAIPCFLCYNGEQGGLVILNVKIDIDKKKTMYLEIPKEYQTREGILKYIDESVKESTNLDDVSFEILK